jgi:putative ABC transport system permease protein
MPEWKTFIRARLAGSGLCPTTEMDVVEELSQHIDDRYQQLRADGVSDDEARARSLRELDGEELVTELLECLPREPQ